MSIEKLVITISAEDRPGVVQTLSDTALANQASWQESSLSHLCGQFVGIVQFEVAEKQRDALIDELLGLAEEEIHITVRNTSPATTSKLGETVELYVEANDRPGIVEEITAALAETSVNVEQLETWRESASMAGYDLFIAQLAVSLPADYSIEQLENALEDVSDDLMVSIVNE